MRAFTVVGRVAGFILTVIGLASVQGDLLTWWGWLRPFRENPWPWVFLLLGLALLFAPTIRTWANKMQQSKSKLPTQGHIPADVHERLIARAFEALSAGQQPPYRVRELLQQLGIPQANINITINNYYNHLQRDNRVEVNGPPDDPAIVGLRGTSTTYTSGSGTLS